MKENKRVIGLGIISLIITVLIGIAVKNSADGILFDIIIMDYIHSIRSATVISIMKIFSFLGSKYFFGTVGLAIFLYLFNKRKRKPARLILLSIIGSYTLNAIIKIIFSRIRPTYYMVIEHGGYSFPSGHSMVSMSFYTTLTYILLENLIDEKYKNIMWVLNFILIGLIGLSRLYLGVHWPTDVLVGYLLGYTFFKISKTVVRG